MSQKDNDLPRVKILPEVVQNKIAAGEVVERAASVVKELVENSLDAGAKSIAVELEEGGQRLLRVTDDGHGMDEENLVCAIERHATSKIQDVDDIFAISTMGFRGEALPSIGSVSRLRISTCTPGAEAGNEILVEGGETKRVSPAPARKGTVVEMRDLFFNTPARRKFMKSASSEVAAVSETLTRLALANPQIAFRLDNGGKRSMEIPAHNSLVERIGALFGRNLTSQLVGVMRQTAGLSIEGFVARPPESRANSRGVYIFLNRRWIKHPGVTRMVADAFRGSLPPRRFPFAVLYLDIDPAQVDVNVHPAKQEVRFENDRLITGAVRRAVEEALDSARMSKADRPGFSGGGAMREDEVENVESSPEEGPAKILFNRAAEAQASYSNPDRNFSRDEMRDSVVLFKNATENKPKPDFSASQDTVNIPVEKFRAAQTNYEPAHVDEGDAQGSLDMQSAPERRLLGQAGNRYLVIDTEDGIRLVDQHALHERWNYEKLKEGKFQGAVQKLLLPVVVELAPSEAALVEEALPILAEVGFEAESFGVGTISISSVPSIVNLKKVEQVVRDVFADLENAKGAVDSIRDAMLKSLACRSAVLFGKNLTQEEMFELIDKFDRAKQPLTCPHGRPTVIDISWQELERRFERS